MVWGCITFYGPGDLSRIHGTLNSEFFLTFLNDYVLNSFTWNGMDPAESIFQQDHSRVHTANVVQQWLAEQEFTVIDWPANSPDLNIIEPVWAYIKHRLVQQGQAPISMDELWERVQDIWNNLPPAFLPELYKSMPKRMSALLKSRGGPIKY